MFTPTSGSRLIGLAAASLFLLAACGAAGDDPVTATDDTAALTTAGADAGWGGTTDFRVTPAAPGAGG